MRYATLLVSVGCVICLSMVHGKVHGCGFNSKLEGHARKTSPVTLLLIDHVDDRRSGILACDAIYGEINVLRSGPIGHFSRAMWLFSLSKTLPRASQGGPFKLRTPPAPIPRYRVLPKPFPRLPKRRAVRSHRCMSIKSSEPFPWDYVERWS